MNADQPVVSIKNQYQGINPHLNSQLQAEGWEAFHTVHIADLMVMLNKVLRGTGYVARLEDSLQIRREFEPPRQPEADVLVWDTDPARPERGPAHLSSRELAHHPGGATAMAADPGRYKDVEYFRAIGIVAVNLPENEWPVAWIELLSPSNKINGRHHPDYLKKREDLILSQTCVFVEMDYLHESPPNIWGCRDYTRQEPGSTAYRVAMADTRGKGMDKGDLYVAAFGVDEPIPAIPVPLHGEDRVTVDLNAAYHQTYSRVEYGVNDDTRVDHRRVPVHFERYSVEDRRRIAWRMAAVVKARSEGGDLETEPPEIDESAIREWAAKGGLVGMDETVKEILARV